MLIDPKELPSDLVPHPRFGTNVHRAGEGIDERQIRRSFYLLAKSVIYPPSAIRADVSKQVSRLGARSIYVDILQECRTCRRPFIFYAREQQFWYEVLRMHPDAQCVFCPECRASDRSLRAASKRFESMIARRDLQDAELKRLLLDAATLIENGRLRNVNKLSWARAQAKKTLASHKELDRLEAAISGRTERAN